MFGTLLFAALSAIFCLAGADLPNHEVDPAFSSYVAHVAAAEALMRLDEPANARRFFETAPVVHRGWEWRFLAARLDESLATLGRHDCTVFELAFNPDGTRLAAVDGCGNLVVRTFPAGEEQYRIAAHDGMAFRVAYSPDGQTIGTCGGDKTAKLWDAATGAPKIVFRGFETPVTSIEFTADGKRVAVSGYTKLPEPPYVLGTVKIWDAATGAVETTLTGGEKPISMLRIRPDGGRVAVSSWRGGVDVWDVNSPERVLNITLPDEGVYTALNCVDYSPDGRLLTAGSKDRTARVWNADSGEQIARLPHGGWVTATRFSPDGKLLLTASHDCLLRLWDTSTWTEVPTLRGHTGGPWAAVFTPDGNRVVSAGIEGDIRVWDARWRDYGGAVRRESAACYSAKYIDGGRAIVTGTHEGTIGVWDAHTLERLASWVAHPGSSTNHVSVSADGRRFVSCSWDKTAKVWDSATGSLVRTFTHDAGIVFAAIGPDGRLVVTLPRGAKELPVWDSETGAEATRLTGLNGGCETAAFSPDGRKVAAACGGNGVALWNMSETDKPVFLKDRPAKIRDVAFSADGMNLAASDDEGRLTLWDVGRAEAVWSTRPTQGAINRVRFSPDGERIACGGNECALVSARAGVTTLLMRPHKDATWDLSFSPDGRRLASCSVDGTLHVDSAIPFVAQREERQTALDSQRRAVDRVARMRAEGMNAERIATEVRADPSLDPQQRGQLMNELLRTERGGSRSKH